MWYLDKFEYTEFSSGVHFFCFIAEITILAKFVQKIKIVKVEIWCLD